MIVYNVTVKVAHSIADQWLEWLNKEHVPEVMESECFTHFKILRLLEIDDSEGPTYISQFYAESKSLYNMYIEKYAQALREKSFEKWGDGFIAFRSVMSVVG